MKRLLHPMMVVLTATAPVVSEVVYSTDFDALTLGPLLAFPGDPGHDGWYDAGSTPPALNEIQGLVANPGRALRGFVGIDNPSFQQNYNRRPLTPPDLTANPIIIFRADFFARTSDLNAINTYSAALGVLGGPHPGFVLMAFELYSGNGGVKGEMGVDVALAAFNGTDNHFAIPLTVGVGLAWETWHTVTVIGDQSTAHYVSITVDGETQDLSEYLLPHSMTEPDVWARGQLMEHLQSEIVPTDWANGDETDDDVMWDNILISVSPELDSDGDGVYDAFDQCPGTIAGVAVDEQGCPPLIPGDLDRDGDVDQVDFGIFQRCQSGPDVPADPNCAD